MRLLKVIAIFIKIHSKPSSDWLFLTNNKWFYCTRIYSNDFERFPYSRENSDAAIYEEGHSCRNCLLNPEASAIFECFIEAA